MVGVDQPILKLSPNCSYNPDQVACGKDKHLVIKKRKKIKENKNNFPREVAEVSIVVKFVKLQHLCNQK